MDIAKLLSMLSGGAQLFHTIVGIVEEVKGTLSEEDAAKVDDALAKIQAENDQAFAATNARLEKLKAPQMN